MRTGWKQALLCEGIGKQTDQGFQAHRGAPARRCLQIERGRDEGYPGSRMIETPLIHEEEGTPVRSAGFYRGSTETQDEMP